MRQRACGHPSLNNQDSLRIAAAQWISRPPKQAALLAAAQARNAETARAEPWRESCREGAASARRDGSTMPQYDRRRSTTKSAEMSGGAQPRVERPPEVHVRVNGLAPNRAPRSFVGHGVDKPAPDVRRGISAIIHPKIAFMSSSISRICVPRGARTPSFRCPAGTPSAEAVGAGQANLKAEILPLIGVVSATSDAAEPEAARGQGAEAWPQRARRARCR